MTHPTHKVYSICFAYLAAMLVFNLGLTQINYYLTIPILVAIAKIGAEFPDVDHHWSNVHSKTTINKIINIIIHATRGKHRSWQTHSIDICVLITFGIYTISKRLYINNIISEVNSEVMILLLLGFTSGWVSHLFSDSLTSEGVRLFCWNKKIKIKFVPKKIGKLRFNTGNEWEEFNYKLMKKINIILGLICAVYPVLLNYMEPI